MILAGEWAECNSMWSEIRSGYSEYKGFISTTLQVLLGIVVYSCIYKSCCLGNTNQHHHT